MRLPREVQVFVHRAGRRGREVLILRRTADTGTRSRAPTEWEPRLNAEHDAYQWCGIDEAERLVYRTETKKALAVLASLLRQGPSRTRDLGR